MRTIRIIHCRERKEKARPDKYNISKAIDKEEMIIHLLLGGIWMGIYILAYI